MPASKQQLAVASADASAAVQQPIAAEALQQQSDAVTSSLQDLLQQFSTLAATATQLPQPPAPAGSTADQQQQQLSAGEVDTASLWQHQLQQLLESAQHLKQQVAENSQSAETLQQQAGAAEGLLESVCRMLAVLQGTRSSSSSDPAGQAAVADAVQVLSALKQELQELQYSLQRLAAEAAGQRMLVCVFGEFLTQLQEQGVVAPEAAAAGIAAALDSTLEQQQESASQPAMLTLLQSFLEANPQVPQMLAVQLAPAVPPMQQEEVQEALPAVELSSTAVQAVADAEHQEVQAVADAEHREVQAVADAEHREVQCEAADSQHAGTQSELLPTPSDHVQTQTETAADHAGRVFAGYLWVTSGVSCVSTTTVRLECAHLISCVDTCILAVCRQVCPCAYDSIKPHSQALVRTQGTYTPGHFLLTSLTHISVMRRSCRHPDRCPAAVNQPCQHTGSSRGRLN